MVITQCFGSKIIFLGQTSLSARYLKISSTKSLQIFGDTFLWPVLEFNLVLVTFDSLLRGLWANTDILVLLCFRGIMPFGQRKKIVEKARSKGKKSKGGDKTNLDITAGSQVSSAQ